MGTKSDVWFAIQESLRLSSEVEPQLKGHGTVVEGSTVYGRGSLEGRLGEVRKPGTRRVVPVVRSGRWSAT